VGGGRGIVRGNKGGRDGVIRGTGWGISRIRGKMGHGWVHMKTGNREKVILRSRGKARKRKNTFEFVQGSA
jgi:hypothetical protein